MTIILEEVEAQLVGRVFIQERKTSTYIVPLPDNKHLFSVEQLNKINNQKF